MISDKEPDSQLAISNYEDFEEELNGDYVLSPVIVTSPKVYSFSFTHSNGHITESEKQNIISQIDNYLLTETLDPKVIDVDIKNDVVEMYFEVPQIYDPNFPENMWPHGGIERNGTYIEGKYCDASIDPLGGSCGRVNKHFIKTRTLPQGIRYYKEIRKFYINGNCNLLIADDWNSFGAYSITTPDYYHYHVVPCDNHPECLTSADMIDEASVLASIVQQYLPSTGHHIMGLERCYFEIYQGDNAYWTTILLVGVPVTGPIGN